MEDETRHRKRRRDELRTGIHSAAAQKSRAHPHDVCRRACASQLLFSAAANPTASRQTAGRDGAAVASRAYPRVARVRGSVSAAGARLVTVLASVSSRASFAAVHPFADISSRLLSPSSRQTASTRLRDGLLELAYPPDAAAHALDDVLVASAEESRRLGPDLAAASDVDARFLALLCTAARRGAAAVASSSAGADFHLDDALARVAVLIWLPLLRRPPPVPDDGTHHQIIDELVATLAPRPPWRLVRGLLRASAAAADVAVDFLDDARPDSESNPTIHPIPILTTRVDTAAALCAALLDLAAKKDANDAEDENDASNSAKEDANDASNSANPLDPLRAAVLGDAAPLLDAVFAFDARRSVPSSRARVAARVVPSACRAADRLDVRASAAAKRRVRSGTSAMISPDAPPSARACGFALLGAFASTVLGPPGASAVAAREDPSLVAALAGGLASDVRAERASARRAIRRAVGDEAADASPWSELVAVAHASEDYASHLVDAARAHFDVLHPPAAMTSSTLSDWTFPVPYEYVAAAWTRGARHENPSVRAATMEAFCARDWSGGRARALPIAFMRDVIAPAAAEAASASPATARRVADVFGARAAATEDDGEAFEFAAATAEWVARAARTLNVAGLTAGTAILAAATTRRDAPPRATDDASRASFLGAVRDVVVAAAAKRCDPEARRAQIEDAFRAAAAVATPRRGSATRNAVVAAELAVVAAAPPELLERGGDEGVRPLVRAWFGDGPSREETARGVADALVAFVEREETNETLKGSGTGSGTGSETDPEPDGRDGPDGRRPSDERRPSSSLAEEESRAREDASAAMTMATLYSFVAGEPTADAALRETTRSAPPSPSSSSDDAENRARRAERALAILRASFRLGASLGERDDEDARAFRTSLRRTYAEDIVPAARALAVAAADVVVGDDGNNPSDARSDALSDARSAARSAARRRAVAACSALEAACRWRRAEISTRLADGVVAPPLDWRVARDAVAELTLRLTSGSDPDEDEEISPDVDDEISRRDSLDALERFRARFHALAAASRARSRDVDDDVDADVDATRAGDLSSSSSSAWIARALARVDEFAATDETKDAVAATLAAGWTAGTASLDLVRTSASASVFLSTTLTTVPRALAGVVKALPRVSAPEHVIAGFRFLAAAMTFALANDDAKRAAAAALTTRMDEDGVDDVRVPSANDAAATIGRVVAETAARATRSSRLRKNAPAWAAAVRAAAHPALFDVESLHLASGAPSIAAVDGAGATLWFFRRAVADGCKSGGSRILRVVAHALAARLTRKPLVARHYAPEVWAVGLSGETGLTRAERLAMAAHWAERDAAAKASANGSANGSAKASAKASADAAALATWMDEGGVGGAAGGHVAARVAALCLVHALARGEIPAAEGEIVDDAARASYRADALRATAATLRVGLAAVAGADPDLAKESYRRGSRTHRRKIRAWQMLCAAAPALDAIEALDEANEKTNERVETKNAAADDTDDTDDPSTGAMLEAAAPAAMATHNLPGVRYHAEVFFTLAAMARRRVVDAVAVPALLDANAKPAAAASFVVVVAGAALRTFRAARASGDAAAVATAVDAGRVAFASVSPWALSHNHSLRVFAQVATHDLLDAFGTETFESWSGSKPSPLVSTLAALRGNAEMIKVRVACGPVFTQSIDVAPAALLAGALDIEETTPDAAGFEGAPASALERVEAFLRISRDEMRAERDAVDRWLWNDAMRAGHDCAEPVAGVASAGIAERDGKGERDVSTATTVTGGASHLQKKVDVAEGGGVGGGVEGVAFSAPSALEALAAGMAAEDAAARGSVAADAPPERAPGLIVVASLVDKIPNLAGLARTCEVLGAEALALADARVVSRRDFTSVSVTAERWLPVRQVPIDGLGAYLERLRREGYALVGLEQTRGAVSLDDFEWAPKTALVLGREREGVDADVLAALDECVVIPQRGRIRSLNVHVSASIAIASYARQAARRGDGS